MKLNEYFDNIKGVGVLSTADAEGKVNAAIYGRPYFTEEDTIAFIAADRLTRANLKVNSSAVYLFKEQDSYEGKRLYLTKICEEKDSPIIKEIRRKKHDDSKIRGKAESRFLIYFKVNKVLPLVGDGK